MTAFSIKKSLIINKEELPVIIRKEIDVNNLSNFTSEKGLISKNIYIAKIELDFNNSKTTSIDKIELTSKEDYPHIN